MATDLRIYMREHSFVFRKRPKNSSDESIAEDPIIEVTGPARSISVILARNKQRLQRQGFDKLVEKCGVKHDYFYDVKKILMKSIPKNEPRTEFEIEVLWNWMRTNHNVDPTGIANSLILCTKKRAVINVLQAIRMEKVVSGDAIIYQGSLPRLEDGHFTLFSGNAEVVVLPVGSVRLLRMHEAVIAKKWDEANRHLQEGTVLASLQPMSGWGELSSLTNSTRTASIRCCKNGNAEILVVPRQPLIECLEARRDSGGGAAGAKPSEAIDFLRQTGLANRISPSDLMRVTNNMIKRTLFNGEILYCKGERCESVFMVLSGDFILDTGESIRGSGKESFRPFQNVNFENCYHISSNSILGDEGVVGASGVFDSTVVCISEIAVVYEVVGAGLDFIQERIGSIRYSGLAYKDLSRLSPALHVAEQSNIFSYMNSLRKVIAFQKPYRGRVTSHSQVLPVVEEDNNSVNQSSVISGSMTSSGDKNKKNNKATKIKVTNTKKTSKKVAFSHSKATAPTSSLKISYDDLNTEENEAIADDEVTASGFEDFMGEKIDGVKYIKDIALKSYRRMIYGVALHHATEAFRYAKRLEDVRMKAITEESMILDQTNKAVDSDFPLLELENHKKVEKKLQTALANFRQRLMEAKKQDGMVLDQGSGSNTAVELFTSFAATLSTTLEDKEGIEQYDNNKDASDPIRRSLNFGSIDISMFQDDDQYKQLTKKIDQFHYWLESIKKKMLDNQVQSSKDGAMSSSSGSNRLMASLDSGIPKVPKINLQSITGCIDKAKTGLKAAVEKRKEKAAAVVTFNRMETPNIRRTIPLTAEELPVVISVAEKEDLAADLSFLKIQALESPQGFFAALDAINFPIRHKYKGQHGWITRYLKVWSEERLDGSGSRPLASPRRLKPLPRSESEGDMAQLLELLAAGADLGNTKEQKWGPGADGGSGGGGGGDDASIYSFSLASVSGASEDGDSFSIDIQRPGNARKDASFIDLGFVEDPRQDVEFAPAIEQHKSYSEDAFEHMHQGEPTDKSTDPLDDFSLKQRQLSFADPSQETNLNPSPGHIPPLHGVESKSVSGASSQVSATNQHSNGNCNASPQKSTKKEAVFLGFEVGTLKKINPPSDAMEQYKALITADKSSRKFLDGKRNASLNSPFQLSTTLEPFDDEAEDKKWAHLSIDGSVGGSSESSSKLIYKVLNPAAVGRPWTSSADSVSLGAASAGGSVIGGRQAGANNGAIDDAGSTLTKGSIVTSTSKAASVVSALKEYIDPSYRSAEVDANNELAKSYNEILFSSMKFSHDLKGGSSMARAKRDKDLSSWQNFSVERSVKTKVGPQMTLPVLIQKSNGPFVSKYGKGKRAKRWGSGGLVPLSGEEEYQTIDGPSSYLEIYKMKRDKHIR